MINFRLLWLVLWMILASASIVPGALRAQPRPAAGSGMADSASQMAGDRGAYLDRLIARARTRELAFDSQWLRLLHYRPSKYTGGYESENDGPAFFMSARGKRDPEAELFATLRAFFSPVSPAQARANRERGKGVPHPVCMFPARLMWLSRELSLDTTRLPVQGCPGFVEYLREVDPGGVTLVFSSYYLNNPASAFGHTWLRFRKAGSLATGEERDLLDYSMDFSAEVDTGNALLYAIKGLFGMFPGRVKRVPYYYKVREYGDFESRDIWEYDLSLGPQATLMLLAHLWEVGHTYFRYFYIDENCSYRILMFLEVADPSLDLMSHLDEVVLPADTIKAVVANRGLVARVNYRPSLRSSFEHTTRNLDSRALDHVEALAEDPAHPLPQRWPTTRTAAVLDAAVDLVDIRHVRDLIKKRDKRAADHKRELLRRRAVLGIKTPPKTVPAPVHERPDVGHDSKRAGVGGGLRAGDTGFATVDFRMAMHDLADPSFGYPELSQIEFMPLRLRVWPRPDGITLSLDEFALVRIVSLTSVDRFDQSISWKVATGVQTFDQQGCDRCTAAYVRGGGGLARTFFGEGLTLFGMLDLSVQAGDLSGIAEAPVRAGAGPFVGARVRLDPSLIVLLSGEWLWYPEQLDPHQWGGEATFRWSFVRNFAFSLEGALRPFGSDLELLLLAYF